MGPAPRRAAGGLGWSSQLAFLHSLPACEVAGDFLHLMGGQFAIFEGPQKRGDLVTLSHNTCASDYRGHKILILGKILEDFAQAIAGIVQPAHYGSSWALQHIAYFIVRQPFYLT